MRILLAAHHFPPGYIGGAEWRAFRTARGLQAAGHDVRVVCVDRVHSGSVADLSWRDEEYQGLEVRRLTLQWPAGGILSSWEHDNALAGEHLAALASEWGAELVHLISGYLLGGRAILDVQRAGVPVVVTLTDFWFLCPRINLLRWDGTVCQEPPQNPIGCAQCVASSLRRYRWPQLALYKASGAFWQVAGKSRAIQREAHVIAARRSLLAKALDAAERVICPSQFLYRMFGPRAAHPERYVFLRQGIELPSARPPHRAPGELVFGFAGQLAFHKGVDLLVDAALGLAADGQRFSVAFWGKSVSGDTFMERTRKRAQVCEQIQWRGSYQRDAVWQVLGGIDVLVMPSRWYENSPNIILEAQAMGIPVVAADYGGMAELVRDGVDGLLFRPGNTADLQRALQRLLTEPSLLETLRNGVPAVKGVETEVAELAELYASVLSERAVQRPN